MAASMIPRETCPKCLVPRGRDARGLVCPQCGSRPHARPKPKYGEALKKARNEKTPGGAGGLSPLDNAGRLWYKRACLKR